MSNYNNSKLFVSERRHMNAVYRELDKERKLAAENVDIREQNVSSGSCDDHHSFIAYGELSSAKRKFNEVEARVQSLYERPYFAHIEASIDNEAAEHFYLSDSETLDVSIPIGNTGMLIPFKRDKNRPASAAFYHIYIARDGKTTDYTVPNNDGKKCAIQPLLICDDKIIFKKLISISLLFSMDSEEDIDVDELLAQILDQNRNNPSLRNIISTLQRKQFEIIAADTNQSFVVQGCAGSGKSQCVLHRLFFLRDELSQQGWEKVKLITPTQLFRNYSADLIKRYGLDDVSNSSISEFYFDILHSYDARFKNRQYVIRLSEEYLPDQYLNEIYSEKVISKIDKEIINAINHYISVACKALGIAVPESFEIETINKIVGSLREAIEKQNLIDDELVNNQEYQSVKNEHESLIKQSKAINRRLQKLDLDIQKNIENIETLQNLLDARNGAYLERKELLGLRALRISYDTDDLKESEKQVDSVNKTSKDSFAFDEEYLDFLNEYCDLVDRELKDYSKKNKPETLQDRNKRKLISKETERNKLVLELNDIKARIEFCELSIRRITEAYEGEKNQITLNKAVLERSEYYLSRIETMVFEQEIWNVLAEIKQKYGIDCLEIERIDDTHRRETKILYKSDLLFYVKLYSELYPNDLLPEFKLFCIDEAQDFHKADYDILKRLYPNAVFNIFGDIDQVLHDNCGVRNWKRDTEISTIYFLNRNYRNTAATVKFCNRRFGSTMQAIGKEKAEQRPKIITDISQLRKMIDSNTVVILKDSECFDEFCKIVGTQFQLEYLDTNAKVSDSRKISCYSVFAAKGLEFPQILVYPRKMTKNQKVVACTRAMERLYYFDDTYN